MNSKLKNGKFNVIILGKCDRNEQLFSKTFPVILNESNIRHKYTNRYDLYINDYILFPKDFLNFFHPELMDLVSRTDILILIYDKSKKFSFDYLKTFYYLYYLKLEEIDKPKNIILIERNYGPENVEEGKDIVDINEAKKLSKLFSGTFCDLKTTEELLSNVLIKCLDNLKVIYNYNDDYSQYKLKIFRKEINCYLLIFGDKESQHLFVKELLNSKCNFNYKKIKEKFYEIKYERVINKNKYNFKITLKLTDQDYYYDSECNILLYDINKIESYNAIKDIINGLIANNSPKFKKIYNLFSLNSTPTQISENENNIKIMEGKNLAFEIGAQYNILNLENNQNLNEEIKIKFDNILNMFLDFINKSKESTDEISNSNNSGKNESSNDKDEDDDFDKTLIYDEPLSFLKEVNNRIKNYLKGNQNSLFYICKKCYSHLSIRIDEDSKILIIYCENCKTEPRGLNFGEIILYNRQNIIDYYCKKCSNFFNFEVKKKLYCSCTMEKISIRKSKNFSLKNEDDIIPIPFFLKDSYCYNHHRFNKYYLKYSKKGLCELCFNERKVNHNYYECFKEEDVDNLFKEKEEELNKELNFINILNQKFKECINTLQAKFQKNIENLIKMNNLKHDILKSILVIKNNNTIISNVKSLKFKSIDDFFYKEDDSIENKLKYIFSQFKSELDINNLYFGKVRKGNNTSAYLNGPFNNLIQNEEKTIVTDLKGLNEDKLICVSFNNGKTKIFNLNINEDQYPLCTISEFQPQQGVFSLYVSNNKKNIWFSDNENDSDIIYLSGYEEIKVIQMNYNYSSYNLLYTFKEEDSLINSIIEINNNSILTLNNLNILQLINIQKKDCHIIDEKKEINDLLFFSDKSPISLNKISLNIICFNLSNCKDFDFTLENKDSRLPFYDNNFLGDNFNNNVDKEDLRENFTLKINNNINPKNKYIKIIKLKNEDKNNSNYNLENFGLDIEKEYTFPKNYELLGSISDEENLLLLNYIKEEGEFFEYLLCIFDFNIDQYICSFQFQNIWTNPKIFVKMKYDFKIDKQAFVACNEDLDFIQYFYDKKYTNKIYYVNIIRAEKKIGNSPSKLLNVDKEIIMMTNNNNYYLSNY